MRKRRASAERGRIGSDGRGAKRWRKAGAKRCIFACQCGGVLGVIDRCIVRFCADDGFTPASDPKERKMGGPRGLIQGAPVENRAFGYPKVSG